MGTAIVSPQSLRDEFHRTMEDNKLRLEVHSGFVGFYPGDQRQTLSLTMVATPSGPDEEDLIEDGSSSKGPR
eukprot:11076925-Prorocentrum_lima.AAC.1